MSKKKRKKSKAAQATAAARAERDARAAERAAERTRSRVDAEGIETVEFKGGGGMMTKMRGGFQAAAGTGPQKQKSKLNTILWVIVAIAAGLLISTSFR